MFTLYRLITFDVYSALFDIESSLVLPLHQALGASIDALAVLRTWRSKQLEYAQLTNSLGRGRATFKTVTRRTLDYTLAKFGLSLTVAQADSLVEEWQSLRLWPEAEEVLSAVQRRGFKVGVLSNGDSDGLAQLLGTLTVSVDHIFSSEQAGFYKPHPNVYRLPLDSLNLNPEQVLHVAGSATDVLGTKAAGLGCYWSNRFADQVIDPDLRPDYEFKNLSNLLEVL